MAVLALRPGLDGASRPSTSPRDAADRRIPDGPPDGNPLESASNGGDKPVGLAGLAPRGAHGVACAGDAGKAMAAHRDRRRPYYIRPRPMRPSGPEHAACRGVLRSRAIRRADSSGH